MAKLLVQRTFLAALVFAAACLIPSAHLQAEEKIGIDYGTFEFAPDSSRPQTRLKVWTFRPAGLNPDSPIVIVMHGVGRNAKGYRDAWAPHGREGGFLVVVPEFSEAMYSTEAYQQGNLRDRAGRPNPPERWTFTLVEKLFDQVKTITGSKVERYHLFGHSGGGQFVQRFVLFMPGARYARAIAANPGYYTIPATDAAYPHGLKGTPLAGGMNPAVFARDFLLLLGEADTRRNSDLRKTPQADAQGLTRLERGRNYFKAAKQSAEAAHAPFNWRLLTVPGVGHSDAKMAPAAVRELFVRPK